ncbi:MAG: hypothetical protein WB579_00965, partial [Bryobacteraceae bacterium]
LQHAARERGSAARTSRELSIFFEKKSTSSSGNARSGSEYFPRRATLSAALAALAPAFAVLPKNAGMVAMVI